ncbi:MAG TPA: polyketide synthase [Anaerolineae bacterium]|nr:polyketide synthase [Anaerolineae bacterium]
MTITLDPTSTIAIIGLACRFPGASDATQFWHNLRHGVESISCLDTDTLDQMGVAEARYQQENFVPAEPLLAGIDQFDAAYFGYSPREAQLLAPQQRIFLQCAVTALENAGYDPEQFAGSIGVYAGMGLSTYLLFNLLNNAGLDSAEDSDTIMLGNDKDFLATRVAYHLNLNGPALTTQTGCSTALVNTHLACDALLSYQCDIALAGGVSVAVPQSAGYLHQQGGITSADGHCRPFDAAGDGTVFGSGVGIVVLKRLEEAQADGDTILAVIRGSAINNDGALKLGYTAPSVDGQAQVIAQAQRVAGISAETVSFIETHGTATQLGDPIEFEALHQVFEASDAAPQACALGAVKSNIGHLDAAAGAAGLIKTILALQHKQIPPTLHFEQPNPALDLDNSPFYVPTELQDWHNGVSPRRAGVSSFGIGGTNAHIVLEEAPTIESTGQTSDQPQLIVLSARTPSALETVTDNLQGFLATEGAENAEKETLQLCNSATAASLTELSGAANSTSQPRNPATSQPRNLATPQPRNPATPQPRLTSQPRLYPANRPKSPPLSPFCGC